VPGAGTLHVTVLMGAYHTHSKCGLKLVLQGFIPMVRANSPQKAPRKGWDCSSRLANNRV